MLRRLLQGYERGLPWPLSVQLRTLCGPSSKTTEAPDATCAPRNVYKGAKIKLRPPNGKGR